MNKIVWEAVEVERAMFGYEITDSELNSIIEDLEWDLHKQFDMDVDEQMAIMHEEEQSLVQEYDQALLSGESNWWNCPICQGDLVWNENTIVCLGQECVKAFFNITHPPKLEKFVEGMLEVMKQREGCHHQFEVRESRDLEDDCWTLSCRTCKAYTLIF